MTYKLDSATTYIVLLVFVGIFIYTVSNYGIELSNNDNAALSNSSKEYISEITGSDRRLGFNTSVYDDQLKSALDEDEIDSKNDFALDFLFGKKKANGIQRIIYVVLNIPEFLLIDLFKLTTLQWLADLLDWALRIFLFVAIVNYVRGRM